MPDLDFDPISFMAEYDEKKLRIFSSQLSQITIDGKPATYVYNPDQYTLELFLETNGYRSIGSTNYDIFSQSVPLSLNNFEVPNNASVFVVEYEYNADYYIN